MVAKWNYKKRQESFRINFAGEPMRIDSDQVLRLTRELDEQQQEVVNPKFVYSIDVSGPRLAVGTGNGTIFLVDHSKQSLVMDQSELITHIMEGVHCSAVSQVRLVNQQGTDLLLSAGNDKQITLWKLPPCSQAPERQKIPQPPKRKAQGKGKKKSKPKGSTKVNTCPPPSQKSALEEEPEPNPADASGEEPKKIAEMSHSSKTNWLATAAESDSLHFFVADQSHSIKVFHATI